MKKNPRIYIAAPLFSLSERHFNTQLKAILQPFFVVFLPQEDGGLVNEMVSAGGESTHAMREVFRIDIEAMDKSDYLLIVLDGRAVDEGAAFELGYCYAHKKACFGLQTDSRRLIPEGNNPMIETACQRIFSSLEELSTWAKSVGS
jgi:nucleoside 2-deoxyribosyltransferase